MKPIYLAADAETYYNTKDKYSLRVMGNEEYIFDPRFQVHGWSFRIDGGPAHWVDGPNVKSYLASFDWPKVVFISHNILFDGAILVWRYGFMPKVFVDTMGLANAFVRPYTGSSSLNACAEHHHWPLKSGVLNEVNGKKSHEIKLYPGMWERLAQYCNDDTDKCWWMFKKYYPLVTQVERVRMDWAVRNYVRGRLRIDAPMLHNIYTETVTEREKLLTEAGISKEVARSRPKFAAHLENLGIEVEYKRGKSGEIPAIAKKDPFVLDLLANGSPEAVAAMRARLAFSSTIETSRAERLLKMARATRGKMLLPTVWHGAHTGRPTGTDGVNPLNFGRTSRVREAIQTEAGYVLVDVDASQIEARLCAWFTLCWTLIEAFADKTRDVYCEVASNLFGELISPRDELERQVGKVVKLACQYGLGKVTLRRRLQAAGIDATEEEAKHYVDTYRSSYPEVLGSGREMVEIFKECIRDKVEIEYKGCLFSERGIYLPSERWIFYNGLHISGHGRSSGVAYYSPRYKSMQSLHPGAINENLAQAMTNDHIGRVHAKYADKTLNMLYDSLVVLAREDEAEALKNEIADEMSTPSPWMAKMFNHMPPLAAKGKIKHHW